MRPIKMKRKGETAFERVCKGARDKAEYRNMLKAKAKK